MSSKKLILISIGPVQTFIQQSRKTVDLYNGSNIFNELIKSSCDFLKEKFNQLKILYPHNQDTGVNCSNYLLAVANGDDNIFCNMEKELTKNIMASILKKYTDCLFKGDTTKVNKTNRYKEILQKQIKDAFNIYCVYTDFNQENYKESYKKVYRQLAGLKNAGTFEQLNEKGAKKCSMCAKRNGIFYSKLTNYSRRYLDENNIEIEGGKIKEGETLCHICFLKRYMKLEAKYPSTVKISTYGWCNRKNKKIKDEYDNLINNIDKTIDEKRYYKDWILEKVKDSDSKRKIKEYLDKKLYKNSYGEKDIPTKYYALVKIDVDDLGKWLSGEYFKNENLLNNQKQLSNGLYEFAKKFNKIIEDKDEDKDEEKVVYAGGDDFLFFVTLDELFDVLEEIERNFKDIQNIDIIRNSKRKLTYSTSIVVAHYKTPLSEVLRVITDKLEAVKDKYKDIISDKETRKNGIAVTFITYSNTLRSAYFKNDKLSLLKKYIVNVNNEISRSFIYTLEREFNYIADVLSYEDMISTKKMFKLELERCICRKLKSKDIEKMSSQIKDLKMFLDNQVKEVSSNKYKLDLQNYFNFLHIGEELSKEMFERRLG